MNDNLRPRLGCSEVRPMEISAVSATMLTAPTPKAVFRNNIAEYPKPTINLRGGQKSNRLIGDQSLRATTPSPRRRVAAAINDISAATDAVPVELTWQVVVGAIAGVTPFVVAGIEFSKRIIAQRRCERCGGSGLVQKKEYYVRCPGCGGFLPWQSWKRFFSG